MEPANRISIVQCRFPCLLRTAPPHQKPETRFQRSSMPPTTQTSSQSPGARPFFGRSVLARRWRVGLRSSCTSHRPLDRSSAAVERTWRSNAPTTDVTGRTHRIVTRPLLLLERRFGHPLLVLLIPLYLLSGLLSGLRLGPKTLLQSI